MSLESAKQFVQKMQDDENFAKSFFSCADPESKKNFIKDNGFEFTKEEIDEARENIDVSGGKCCGWRNESCWKEGSEQTCPNETTGGDGCLHSQKSKIF